jgi:hypothetical protein
MKLPRLKVTPDMRLGIILGILFAVLYLALHQ